MSNNHAGLVRRTSERTRLDTVIEFKNQLRTLVLHHNGQKCRVNPDGMNYKCGARLTAFFTMRSSRIACRSACGFSIVSQPVETSFNTMLSARLGLEGCSGRCWTMDAQASRIAEGRRVTSSRLIPKGGHFLVVFSFCSCSSIYNTYSVKQSD